MIMEYSPVDLSASIHFRRLVKRGLTMIPPRQIEDRNAHDRSAMNVYEFLLAEPYSTITGYFIDNQFEEILPVDSESGLFLPRIPVSERSGVIDLKEIIKENGIVIPSKGTILTGGKGGPENQLVLFSIACFSLFIKFFHLVLTKKKDGKLRAEDFDYIDRIRMHEYRYSPYMQSGNKSEVNGSNITDRIAAAGRSIVSDRLVDSIFGNISLLENDHVFISKAGSFLDNLDSQIIKVPLNGMIEGNTKPSSEVEVHRNIYKSSTYTHVIHGHPLFTVILSLDNEGTGNTLNLDSGESIPVINGEDESGKSILAGSVPSALSRNGNVIIKGHGIFSASEQCFGNVLQNIKEIENYCRQEYFRRLR